ncbi:MAG: hypothetical protein AAGA60_07340 [Cyanobacteria bacterium P01_E01_bin.42]
MKLNRHLLKSGLIAIALIGLSFPIPKAKAEQLPILPLELDRLAYFEGTWSCEQPGDLPDDRAIVLTWTVERDLNDFWYLGYAEEMRSPTNLKPVNAREFLGYNADLQRLVRFVAVGNGNFLKLTSWGWENEQFVWEGSLIRMGDSIPIRQVIVKKNNDSFAATYFIRNEANNGWQGVIQETCDRQS